MKSLGVCFCFLIFCAGCKNYGYLNPEGKQNVEEINLTEYNIYQFSMSRDVDTNGQLLSNIDFYETSKKENSGAVHEIIYLLRHKNDNSVIYLTTFSHKYLRKDSGVFNSLPYKKYVVLSEMDHMCRGKEVKNRFSFYDPNGKSYAQNIHMFFTETDSKSIKIDSLTNNYAREKDRIETRFIKIEDDVFGIPINFKSQFEKTFAYEYKCGRGKNTGIYLDVTHLYIDDRDIYVKYTTENGVNRYLFLGEKVKYIEPQ